MDITRKVEKNQVEKNKNLGKHAEKKRRCKEFIEYMEDKKIKLDRLESCSNYLLFQTNKDKTKFLLSGGFFCNNRFCPVCSWLKAKRTAFELLELLKVVQLKEDKAFVFITLTVPNVKSLELKKAIENMNISFNRLWKVKEFMSINMGFIRKLEVTYNKKRDDYHPHFHLIVAVNKSYFKSRDYLKKRRLLELWQRATRDFSITQVDIKPCRMDSVKQILELATYSAKQNELYSSKDVFDGFYNGLFRKKLLVFNGLFKEYRQKIQNEEINVDEILELANLKEKTVAEILYLWDKQDKVYEEKQERNLTEQEQRSFYDLELDVD